MKFSKYNNPKKKRHKVKKHSANYIREREEELYKMLAGAETDEERSILIDAFHISINS